MKKISEILKESSARESSLPKRQKSQTDVIEIQTKFGSTYIEFARRFNPSIQGKLASINADYVYCYLTTYPKLKQVGDAYSNDAPSNWLKIQFENLNDFVGTREKMTTEQINELAALFLIESQSLNIAEVALFFIKLKTGHFGEFYGTIDPLRIMVARKQFIEERNNAISSYRLKMAQKEERKKRQEWEKSAITYEEYLKNKQQKEIENERREKNQGVHQEL